MAGGPVFTNSYNITNRSDPFTLWVDDTSVVVPLPGSQLSFYWSQGTNYDSDDDDYDPTDQTTFTNALATDLQQTADSSGSANLVIYVHGLGNTYSDAIAGAANLGLALQAAGYGGLVIGFSWPSYSEFVALFPSYYATSRPPQNTSGTIRDNINGSVGSFQTMLKLLQSIQVNNKPIKISIISHSEGNLMVMWGMANNPPITPTLNHSILLAADISAAMLQGGQPGSMITENFNDVSVYFSGTDPDLCYSDYEFFAFHDQTYPTRLGLIGPFAYPAAVSVPTNVTGLDCSQVTVNLGSQTNVHSSYMSLPSVLSDMTSVLTGAVPVGRALYPGSSNPWYYLKPNQAVAAGIREVWSGKTKVRPKLRSRFVGTYVVRRSLI
jgi:esterase/lipase superfamily enzyme